jgi:curli biogenesis system outer membrane secretion channel CsgG
MGGNIVMNLKLHKVTAWAGALALVASASIFGALAQDKKPRIAVLPFDSSHISTSYASLSTSVVNGMFETELFKTGKFIVVERKRIQDVMKEQGLGLSGAVDATTAAKVGKILGVELILTGDITSLGVKQSGAHTGFLGGAGGSKNTLQGGLDIRLISTTSTQIVFADNAQNTDSSMKISVFGTGGGVDFDETKIDKVFRPCVVQLCQKMAGKVGDMVGEMRGGGGLAGKIANVSGEKIYLNIDSGEGVKVGDAFEVYRQGEEIRDPDTGAVLDVETKLIGKIIVTEVKDKVSIASSQSGSGFQKGDVIRPPKS